VRVGPRMSPSRAAERGHAQRVEFVIEPHRKGAGLDQGAQVCHWDGRGMTLVFVIGCPGRAHGAAGPGAILLFPPRRPETAFERIQRFCGSQERAWPLLQGRHGPPWIHAPVALGNQWDRVGGGVGGGADRGGGADGAGSGPGRAGGGGNLASDFPGSPQRQFVVQRFNGCRLRNVFSVSARAGGVSVERDVSSMMLGGHTVANGRFRPGTAPWESSGLKRGRPIMFYSTNP